MIPDYKQPILLIRLPGDGKPEVRKAATDEKVVRRRENGPEDPRVRIISGATTQLQVTHTRQFQAVTVQLEDRRITWSVSHGAGSINAQGVYTAPTTLPTDPNVTIRAASTSRSELYDERSFRLTDSLVRVSLRVLNCSLVALGGSPSAWTLQLGGQTVTIPAGVVSAGGSLTIESSQTMDVSLIRSVQLSMVFQPNASGTAALRDGQASHTFEAVRISATLYEVNLCVGDPVWTYLNATQSYTAHCSLGDWYGTPVTRSRAASLFSSEVSPAAANAAALAAARAEAEAALVCMVPTLGMSAQALTADGRIRLTVWVPEWYGNVTWNIAIGEGEGNFSGGTWIKSSISGVPHPAEEVTMYSEEEFSYFPAGYRAGYSETKFMDFYFHEIDAQWLIGNEDAPTWLLPVTVRMELTDPDPHFVKTVTWRKYLLV